MKLIRLLLLSSVLATMVLSDGKDNAGKLGLDASSKAIKQWEKIFGDAGKMAKLGIDKLSDADKEDLKKYLTSHAADSDHPQAAGM
ncbi:MAG: hypothetical protein A2019_04885 [Sulfurimonas sp. GWF2_37_8]|nr:MAG: hypothetical protein A2019_04885 [Sulfurimonas sp. GWF2_37_8]